MSEETKKPEGEEKKQKIEVDSKEYEWIKSKANDMDKYKSELKETKELLREIQDKIPEGKEKPVKDQLLALLQKEEEQKTENQILQEQVTTMNNSFEELKQQLENEKSQSVLLQKKSKAKDLANGLKFQNADTALKLIDVNADDVEGQLKALAESQPYLIKQEPKKINEQTNVPLKELPEDLSTLSPENRVLAHIRNSHK